MRQVPNAAVVSPLVQIALGSLLGLVVVGVLHACGAGGQLTPLMRCKLEALKVLPQDPGNATIYDAVDVIERLNACHEVGPDGGAS